MKKTIISLSLVSSILLLTGCNGIPGNLSSLGTPTKNKKEVTKKIERIKNLPIPKNLKNMSSETSISIEWALENKHLIDGYHIYRNDDGQKTTRFNKIATVDNKFSTHFVDNKLIPNKNYSYVITTFDKNGESFNSPILSSITKTVIDPVTFIETINNLPNMIKLIWRPQVDSRVNGYIIEKLVDGKWKEQVTVNNNLTVEYFDTNLDNNEICKYRIISVSKEGQKSQPSKVVVGNTKKLPHVVSNINVSQNFPKSIDLSWSKNTEKDIVKYKIYTEGNLSSLLGKLGVQKIAETTDNNIRLDFKEDGQKVSFFVTAVDKDGLESKMQKQPIFGQTRPKPGAPYFTTQEIQNDNIVINWNKGDDRNVKFKIIKSVEKNFMDKETTEIKVTGNTLVDKDLKKGTQIIYKIIGIDKDGIESSVSEELKFGIQ